MSVPFTIQLDPAAIAPDRTMLDLNDGAIRTASIDWGDADVTAYETQEGQYGNAVADFILPNRTITIQLGLGMDDGAGGVSQEQARAMLQQKVGLLQREGGQLLRQRSIADPAMYADIVRAVLTPNDVWGETGNVELWTLVLETLPDFYGDEITLDSATATGVYSGVLLNSGSDAVIEGDYPPRARIVVTDSSGNDQRGLLWGLRSRHYDPATTAALTLEAESLTPVNGGAVVTDATASGGHAVSVTLPGASSWTAFLVLQQSAGAALTHTGTYRVWVRVKTNGGSPAIRLQWGVGSLSVPVSNDDTAIPDSAGWYLVDLGTVRLDAPAVGTHEWIGVLQASDAGTRVVTIDAIYLQPLDEAAGRLIYTSVPSPSIVVAGPNNVTAGADDGSIGTLPWSNPSHAADFPGGSSAFVSFSGAATSHFLVLKGLGFAIPTGVTIIGIVASINKWSASGVTDNAVRLAKAGVVQAGDRSAPGVPWPTSFHTATDHGGSSDLWGGTWTPADINNAGFGVAISAAGSGTQEADVDYAKMTVYYEYSSGFTVAQDAVVYASQVSELRHDSMLRTRDGSVYGPVSQQQGDLVRLPPSANEERPLEVFVKPTRGDLGSLTDGGVDAFSVRVKYRPCWLGRP